MAEQQDDVENTAKQRRVRSPNYPGVSLPKAVEHARTFYQHEHKHAAAPAVAARAIGFSDETSGPAAKALSALKKFALLLGNERGDVQLSPLALDIVLAPSRDDPKKRKALREAVMSPIIYRELWEKWNGRLPSDQNIAYYLERERGFNRRAIPDFIRDFRESLVYAGLTEEGPDRGQERGGRNGGRESESILHDEVDADRQSSQKSPQMKLHMLPGIAEDVFKLREGLVVLQYPEELSSASFEDFESWLQLSLRKVKRSIRCDDPTLDQQ